MYRVWKVAKRGYNTVERPLHSYAEQERAKLIAKDMNKLFKTHQKDCSFRYVVKKENGS